ncbi:MFS transporter [Nonomuraea indica]|uniref:MFS transporter n=1 Tax=Nonomuraea indica TaxID=1581193 RepID=UPI001FE79DE4|nr:MFS transporter [Nonomuraea indica]
MAARTGDEMSGPALLLAGLALSGSPVPGSWLLAGLTASAAVGGPLLGALLDRAGRPGRMVGWCLLGYTAGLLAVLLGLGRLPDAALVAVAALAGLLGPALTGGWTSQLPLVVPPDRLARANALDAISYNVAGLVGPAAVAAVAAATSGQTAVLVSAALLLAAVPPAWTLPPRRPTPAPGNATASDATATDGAASDGAATDDTTTTGAAAGGTAAGGAALRRELAAGFGAIARNASLRRATATSMVSFCGVAVLVVGTPLLGAELTGEASYGALLLAVTAAAALAANTAAARLRRWEPRPDTVLAGSTLLLGAAMALAAGVAHTGGPFALAVLAAALAGAAEGPQLTALLAVRHREAPPRLRGQIFTTGASLKITSYAGGAALAGPLAAYDLGAALLAGAMLQVLAAGVYRLLSRPSGRLREPSGTSAAG